MTTAASAITSSRNRIQASMTERKRATPPYDSLLRMSC